jgi:hypothetical protein
MDNLADMTGKILLIDNYDSFTWNLYHYLGELGAQTQVVRNDAISADEAIARKPGAILLSPGPCTPNEAGICLDADRQGGGGRHTADGRLPWPSVNRPGIRRQGDPRTRADARQTVASRQYGQGIVRRIARHIQRHPLSLPHRGAVFAARLP